MDIQEICNGQTGSELVCLLWVTCVCLMVMVMFVIVRTNKEDKMPDYKYISRLYFEFFFFFLKKNVGLLYIGMFLKTCLFSVLWFMPVILLSLESRNQGQHGLSRELSLSQTLY